LEIIFNENNWKEMSVMDYNKIEDAVLKKAMEFFKVSEKK